MASLANNAVDSAHGTIRLLSVLALTDEYTVYEDKSALGVEHLRLEVFREGDAIMRCGDREANGAFIASHIERLDPSDFVIVKGHVVGNSPDAGEFEVLGIRVNLSDQTAAHGISGELVPPTTFIEQLSADQITVSAKGYLVGESPYTMDAHGAWIRK